MCACWYPASASAGLCFRRWLGFGLLATTILVSTASPAAAQAERQIRCVIVDVYTQNGEAGGAEAARAATELADQRPGVRVRTYNIDEDEEARQRCDAIAKYFKIKDLKLPLTYACRQHVLGFKDAKSYTDQLKALLVMDVYVRYDCPRCARAKEYLKKFQARYPGLEVRLHDVIQSSAALNEFNRLTRHYNIAAASVPGFHYCDQIVIGFDSEETSGKRVEAVLTKWTFDCKLKAKEPSAAVRRDASPTLSALGRNGDHQTSPATNSTRLSHGSVLTAQRVDSFASRHDHRSTAIRWSVGPPRGKLPLGLLGSFYFFPQAAGENEAPPPLAPEDLEPPPPALTPESEPGDAPSPADTNSEQVDSETIELPVFGSVNAKELGLPVFTLTIGLVDGFNPCAMWVLLFLLSVLVNLKDRWKILAVAGTFVLISGAAYYAFMAAWLNVLMFVGMLRGVQITLACLAIFVGTVHVKDFFAFKKGLTLSIPESAKPGIYARVRAIVNAENLTGAIVGASILAVLVNIIELLCTAGLPALYTQVLAMRQLPAWQNYLYLLLYNAAYMFDDTLMVAIVVATLSHKKMQETHGRWLKLVSGSVILVFGLVMLFKPEWLQFV